MPLRAGEGYVSFKEFVFFSTAYGLTDNISFLLGFAWPTIFEDGTGMIGALKYAQEVDDDLYLAAGGEGGTRPSFSGSSNFMNIFGIGFVGATYGKADAQITLNLGKPFLLGGDGNDLGDLIVVVAGQVRIGASIGLVSENWLFTFSQGAGQGDFARIHALAMRWLRNDSSFDFGFIALGGEGVAIPWVDWTWNIGKVRRSSRGN